MKLGIPEKAELSQTYSHRGTRSGLLKDTVSMGGIVSGCVALGAGPSDENAPLQELRGLIQTDRPSMGNFAAVPLVDDWGRAIGIKLGLSSAPRIVNFAIPIKATERDLEDLKSTAVSLVLCGLPLSYLKP